MRREIFNSEISINIGPAKIVIHIAGLIITRRVAFCERLGVVTLVSDDTGACCSAVCGLCIGTRLVLDLRDEDL